MENESRTLADYFAEEGAKDKSFMTPEGVTYTVLGFAQQEEGTSRRMKIRRKEAQGDLEELIDTDSHLADLRVAIQLEKGKFYKRISDKKVFFYNGESLIGKFDVETRPEEAALMPIEDTAAYMEALKQKADALSNEAAGLQDLYDFMSNQLRVGIAHANDQRREKERDQRQRETLDQIEQEFQIGDDVNLDSSGSGSGLLDTGTGEYDITEDSMVGTACPEDTNTELSPEEIGEGTAITGTPMIVVQCEETSKQRNYSKRPPRRKLITWFRGKWRNFWQDV